MLQTTGLRRSMTAVADEAGLHARLLDGDGAIELTADLYLTESARVEGNLTLDGRHHTIRRAAGFTGPLFLVHDGALTLTKITLDGYRVRTAPGGALILVVRGTLTLEYGAVLQNNHAAQSGGAVRLETGHGGPAGLRMLSNSAILNCQSDAEGGGIFAAFDDAAVQGFVRIGGSCLLRDNAAVSGGAMAARHQGGGRGLVVVEGCAKLLENTSSGHGGGIFYANDAPEPAAAALRIGGSARLAENRALAGGARGGGVYVRTINPDDRLIVGERAVITQNTAWQGGGLCLDSKRRCAGLMLTGGTVTQNRAEHADDDLCVLP